MALSRYGERNCIRSGDRDYHRFAQDKPFRYSLINQGFDFTEVTLGSEIPQELDILVIADVRIKITDEQMSNLKNTSMQEEIFLLPQACQTT